MRLVPTYTPDPDYIDRQLDVELAAEHPDPLPAASDSERSESGRIAS